MIQSVTLPSTAALAAPGDALLQMASEMPKGPDFGALLALSTSAATPSELPLAGPAGVPVPTPALPPELAPDLPVAATTGNILPLALPVSTAEPAASAPLAIKPGLTPAVTDPAPPIHPAETAKRFGTVQHAPRRKTEEISVAAEPKGAPTDQPAPAAEAVAVPELVTLAATSPNSTIVAAPIQQTANTLEPAAADPAAPRANSAKPLPEPKPADAQPQPVAQAYAHAAPQAAFLRAVTAPVPPSPEQAIESQPSTPRARAALRVEIALPVQATLAAKPAEKIAAPLRSRADPAAEVPAPTTLAAPVSPVPQTILAAPVLAASPRPLDFAALVDRLVAAREAVQPPGALLTVAHAEFGPVELRFRHDERGLAVSLASADPDFARVAAAATPPQLPPSTAQSSAAEPGQPGARGDSQSAASSSASSNPRGQQHERRGEAAPQPARQQRSTAAQRSGIFA